MYYIFNLKPFRAQLHRLLFAIHGKQSKLVVLSMIGRLPQHTYVGNYKMKLFIKYPFYLLNVFGEKIMY